jgi:hypothetical protein
MASFADAYGYTPADFLALTLPQISIFGDYSRAQAEEMNNRSKGGQTSSSSLSKKKSATNNGQWSGTHSIESLIGMYGSTDAKKDLMNETLHKENAIIESQKDK